MGSITLQRARKFWSTIFPFHLLMEEILCLGCMRTMLLLVQTTYTTLKINMSPKERPCWNSSSLPTTFFRGSILNFGDVSAGAGFLPFFWGGTNLRHQSWPGLWLLAWGGCGGRLVVITHRINSGRKYCTPRNGCNSDFWGNFVSS